MNTRSARLLSLLLALGAAVSQASAAGAADAKDCKKTSDSQNTSGDASGCVNDGQTNVPMQGVASAVDAAKTLQCNPECATSKAAVDACKIACKGDGPSVAGVYAEPTKQTCSSVSYQIPERKLDPGQAFYFSVPEAYRNRGVSFVILGHRQDPNTKDRSKISSNGWDNSPGHTSVQVLGDYQGAASPEWRYWCGDASGKWGAKYAEIGDEPELEGLYEWNKLGHCSLADGSTSNASLHPELMRLWAVGMDPVLISELTLKVDPPKATEYIQGAFSKGTVFPKPGSHDEPVFGGGQKFRGHFPGAVVLGQPNPNVKLPKGWRIEGDSLHIPLPKGKTLTAVDIACGDSHQDGQVNSDGGFGQQGWSRLSMRVQHANGKSEVLMNRENVPPEGMLTGNPPKCDNKIKAGDELVVQGADDLLYVMGLRIGLQ